MIAIFSLALAVWLGSLDQSIANTLLPAIAADLQVSPAESVIVVHAYQMAVVTTLLPLAALGDRWGARRVFLAGVALFSLASLGSALATDLQTLALFRAIQGIGSSGVMSVNLALVRQIFPPDKLGRGTGLNAFVVGMGYSLGPTVASLLLSVLPWPWLFGLQAPLGALGWWLARKPFAGSGLIEAVLMLPLVPGLGFSSGGARIWVQVGPINFQPGEFSSFASSFTRKPAASRSALIFWQVGSTVVFQSPRGIGTITTWCGAMRGGRTRPLSSPWVMITPPMSRVETPHDVP